MVFVLFGLPGVGKTYVGKVFEEEFGFYVHEADLDLPGEMRVRLEGGLPVTDEMRGEFFGRVVGSVRRLIEEHENVVVTQTFIRERYREFFLREVASARFVLVTADTDIREKRLGGRKEFPLDPEYARKMAEMFERPRIAHKVIVNNVEGREEVLRQVRELLEVGVS